jgi:hypothetical protein
MVAYTLKGGYVGTQEDDTVPLLASTEKLLALLGYVTPCCHQDLRENGRPAVALALVTKEETKDSIVVTEDIPKDPLDKKAANAEAAATTTSTTIEEFPTMKRVFNSSNQLTAALWDIASCRQRDYEQNKERADPPRKDRGDRHKKVLVQQRDSLKGKTEEEELEQATNESTRRIIMVRALNSLRMLTPILLAILQHDCRNDQKLKIKKHEKGTTQSWLIGELVYDVTSKNVFKQHGAMLEETLALLGCHTLDDWSIVLDLQMKDALAMLENKPAPSLPTTFHPFADLADKSHAEALAKRLDDTLALSPAAVNKDQVHDKYLASIEALRARIETTLQKRYKDARLSIYGSCLADLSLGKNADVDMSLFIGILAQDREAFEAGEMEVDVYQRYTKSTVYNICRLLEALQKEFRGMQPVARARIPVIRGTWIPAENPHSDDGSIDFDICLLNDIAVCNSNLIKEYTLVDQRVRPLMITIKQWAKEYDICSAKDQTLSSYAWLNMVIFYLQCLGLVPNLQSTELGVKCSFKKDPLEYWHSVRSLDTWYTKWDLVQEKGAWKPAPGLDSLSVSSLLYGFYKFYSGDFPLALYMVSIMRGAESFTPKSMHRRNSLFFCIEDPFETFDSHIQHDLCAPVNEPGMKRIMSSLHQSALYLRDLFTKKDVDEPVDALWPKPPAVKKPQQNNGEEGRNNPRRNGKTNTPSRDRRAKKNDQPVAGKQENDTKDSPTDLDQDKSKNRDRKIPKNDLQKTPVVEVAEIDYAALEAPQQDKKKAEMPDASNVDGSAAASIADDPVVATDTPVKDIVADGAVHQTKRKRNNRKRNNRNSKTKVTTNVANPTIVNAPAASADSSAVVSATTVSGNPANEILPTTSADKLSATIDDGSMAKTSNRSGRRANKNQLSGASMSAKSATEKVSLNVSDEGNEGNKKKSNNSRRRNINKRKGDGAKDAPSTATSEIKQ